MAVLLLTGCGAAGHGGEGAPSSTEDTLTVYAAASLANSFEKLGSDFERTHPGVDVKVDSAGSADLAQRILEGAPVDVFAAADERTVKKVTDGDPAAGEPSVFATNRLVLVTPADNPGGIKEFGDLRREGVKLVQCAPQVPCGAAAQKLAEVNGVPLHPVSQENSVTDVLGKVTSGQADVGLVYATDARSAGDRVKTVAIPNADRVTNRYSAVTFSDSPNPEAAKDFVKLVRDKEGQSVLREAGFGAR